MRDGGKGDKRRPLTIPEEQFNNNWDAIFKKAVGEHLVKEAFKGDDNGGKELLEELRKGALNPGLRTYDGKLK